ncbi:DUF3990 domain-containing protein [Peribacillus loiseleuriae]|uniref:DUF3990 domain-containing protein n=1 Tax=Peribacillus loiseleuriae TaxID=1679170 RepID=UPI003D06A18A
MAKGVEKYLKKNKWYHATTLSGWKEICDKKLQVNHNKNHELDFGYGFYLTPKLDQANKFIQTIISLPDDNLLLELDSLYQTESNQDDKVGVIVEFDFIPYDWYTDKSYNHKILSTYDDEFAEFVFYNRTENIDGSNQHKFDFIFGVMSDSIPTIEIQKYRDGQIGKDEVIESLKKSTSSKQLSIHNQVLCDIIYPCRAFIIDTGEELDINDYNDNNDAARHDFAHKTVI